MAGQASALSAYHQRVQRDKRSAILRAATALFLRNGYDGTSLAKVASAAGVSTATLFKRFPTKAALFDAIVTEHWALGEQPLAMPEPGDPATGLTRVAERYVELITRQEMVDLFRIVIAEAPRFPELAQRHFTLGKLPYFDAVRQYLELETAHGTLRIDDAELACTHFLGMLATFSFWPQLILADYEPSAERTREEIDEAVRTVLERYAP